MQHLTLVQGNEKIWRDPSVDFAAFAGEVDRLSAALRDSGALVAVEALVPRPTRQDRTRSEHAPTKEGTAPVRTAPATRPAGVALLQAAAAAVRAHLLALTAWSPDAARRYPGVAGGATNTGARRHVALPRGARAGHVRAEPPPVRTRRIPNVDPGGGRSSSFRPGPRTTKGRPR